MSNEVFNEFPKWALLPKKETNVESFLIKYPEYDGRGIKIAIVDSGVDPGAPGLQTTTDGKIKIVDMVDCSGAGDVDTTKVVEPVDGVIIGLTGRKLKIPKSWTNPSNKYHIGLKNAFELYSKSLRERIIKEQKEKLWDPSHKRAQAEAARMLIEFNAEHQNTGTLPLDKKLLKEEYEAATEVLQNLEKKYNNVGPTYDCVVFHDGKTWRALVDTSETGDLESGKLLSSYSENYEYSSLTPSDRLNYAVNIYDEGNLLEIVSVSSAHGTHVASIAAAHFPDSPEKNGVAPGAQIVSLSISDNRISSMETGASITRACIKIINSKCNVLNMSYGEHAHWLGGRVIEIIHEMINKHGVIMVTSAGNRGPALSTLGTPPSSISSPIGVAAYISPEMMIAEYSLREKLPGMAYTWSSRGPGLHGDFGISICAPGGAITSVPNFMLRGSQLMNGTSMASPHAAGCVCLLLSALKAKGLPHSPYLIKRAIEATAYKVNTYDPFSMGHGLLQVDRAYDHIIQYSNCIERDLHFNVTIGDQKGIYLRERYQTEKPYTAVILVEPEFVDNANADSSKKIEFEMNLNVICDATWVVVPSHLNMMYTTRSFTARIDPCGLPPGEHFACVKAYDSVCPEKGPVFEVPIFVLKPTVIEDTRNWSVTFKNVLRPCNVYRHFFDVPAGATYARLRLESEDSKHDASITVHAIQLRPQFSCRSHEFYKIYRVGPKEKTACVFQVQEKRLLELVIAKWWSNADTMPFTYSISFHGMKADTQVVAMQAADGIHRVDVTPFLQYEELLPSISIKNHVMTLRPVEHKVSPLKSRDVIPDGRQIYEICLTYHFIVAKTTEVTPSFALLSDLLYESEFESQLWMMFDSNKQHVCSGDAYPKIYSYCIKLEKGEYQIKLQIRHEQSSLLERLSDAPMLMCAKLPSSISMDIYDKNSQALIGGKKMNMQVLPALKTVPLFISPMPCDKIPKNCNPGDYLQGTISFAKEEAVKKVDTVPFKYFISELPQKKNSTAKVKEDKNSEKTPDEEFAEALRDFKINWISKLQGKSAKDLFDAVHSEDPNHLPTLQAKLQSLDQEKERKIHLEEIVAVADKILGSISSVELMAFFGSKTDKKDSVNNKTHEKQKSIVVDALTRKGVAMCDYILDDKTEDVVENNELTSKGDGEQTSSVNSVDENASTKQTFTLGDIDEVYGELQKWVDMADPKVAHFTEKHAMAHQHYSRALKLLLKQQDEKPIFETEKKCIELYRKLGWTQCAEFVERSLFVKYPPSYRLF